MPIVKSSSDAERYARKQKEALQEKYAVIRQVISAQDICNLLGLELVHGRCSCPFHHGTDKNMKVYEGDRGFYCFVCHESGDCIKLAKQLLGDGWGYHQTAVWLDKTFGLNLFNHKPSLRERMARYAQHGGNQP